MCDTLCAIGAGRTLFGKNSDRPPGEVQLVEAHGHRGPGGTIRTQYLTLDDTGSEALVGSRPAWLWGFEHGVNEVGVAIGNEAVTTIDDPSSADPGLIGMDLVRLGLERGENADDALAIMTWLLERHGQGGDCYESGGSYFSSFLIADPRKAWVLETSGRTWVAKESTQSAAISNRLTLTDDWDASSEDVQTGASFDRWRHPEQHTGFADVRLDASRAFVSRGADAIGARDVAAHLRHHGERAWGTPGGDPADVSPIPDDAAADGTGVTVCMHVRGAAATTSSMVCELPESPAAPMRAWVALGSPCVSVFVPVFPPFGVPGELGKEETWRRFAALRDRAEAESDTLAEIRAVLAPVEAELWDEADEASGHPERQEAFVAGAWPPVDAVLHRLGV